MYLTGSGWVKPVAVAGGTQRTDRVSLNLCVFTPELGVGCAYSEHVDWVWEGVVPQRKTEMGYQHDGKRIVGGKSYRYSPHLI